METDLVSWLPPRHPKSVKTLSAAKLREKRLSLNNDEIEEEKRDNRHANSDRDSSEEDDERPMHRSKRDDRKSGRRDDKYTRKKLRKEETNNLDPMDPAAYSDIPQGTWSDGLETNKTRADNSASGALFQQRPYPAPGEVLALNKEKKKK